MTTVTACTIRRTAEGAEAKLPLSLPHVSLSRGLVGAILFLLVAFFLLAAGAVAGAPSEGGAPVEAGAFILDPAIGSAQA
jgi:hypothetical protein